MPKFMVELEQFEFDGHVGPDGTVHLAPVNDGDYKTHAKKQRKLVVEAGDPVEAEARFRQALGITTTEKQFKVGLVEGELPKDTAVAKVEEREARVNAAEADLEAKAKAVHDELEEKAAALRAAQEDLAKREADLKKREAALEASEKPSAKPAEKSKAKSK